MSTDKIQKLPRLWPFKKTFYDYPIADARRIFRNDLQIETDRYLVGITEE